MNVSIREAAAIVVAATAHEPTAHEPTAEQTALIQSQLAPAVAQAASKTHDAARTSDAA